MRVETIHLLFLLQDTEAKFTQMNILSNIRQCSNFISYFKTIYKIFERFINHTTF